MLNFFRPLTAIEALDNELARLDEQLGTFTLDEVDVKDSVVSLAFVAINNQRTEIQKTLIELAKRGE